MIWVRADFLNTQSPTYLQLLDSMQKYHIGGFAMTVRWEPPFLYRSEPYEAAELLKPFAGAVQISLAGGCRF